MHPFKQENCHQQKRKRKIGNREGKSGQKGRGKATKKTQKNPQKSVDSLKNNSRGTLKLTFLGHQNAPI